MACSYFQALGRGGNPLCITNPIFSEYAFLPVPKRKKKVLKVASGFGFIPTTGKYKLLRAVLRRDHGYHPKSEGAVCTLGTNIWQKLGEMPFPLHGKLCSGNLHGALHWIANDFMKPDFIFSFELENEQVRPIPPPPVDAFGHKTIWMSLGVLGECLCIFDNLSYSHLVLWKMKHYGIVVSWTRDIILKASFAAMLPTHWLRPVTNWKDREILGKCGNGALVSYNPNMHGFERLEVSGFECICISGICNSNYLCSKLFFSRECYDV